MRIVLAAIVAVSLGACSSEPKTESVKEPVNTSAMALQEARTLYVDRCAVCHGAQGKGDGPAAASLNPKPRNYADPAWQATVTDAELEAVILKGGPATGKSAMMPPNPDLARKPEVLKGLVQIIRGFAQPR